MVLLVLFGTLRYVYFLAVPVDLFRSVTVLSSCYHSNLVFLSPNHSSDNLIYRACLCPLQFSAVSQFETISLQGAISALTKDKTLDKKLEGNIENNKLASNSYLPNLELNGQGVGDEFASKKTIINEKEIHSTRDFHGVRMTVVGR